MRQNNTSTSFLLLGSLLLICTLLPACKGRVDYIFDADWIYINNSSHAIRIEGVERFSMLEELVIDIAINGSQTIRFGSDAGGEVKPEDYPLPRFKEGCTLTTKGREYKLVDGQFIRNKDNYSVKKIRFNYYQFTYIFTDENIAELEPKY